MQIEKTSIEDVENFFATITLPKTIELGPGLTIVNMDQFLTSRFAVLKNWSNVPIYESFYSRLIELKKLLS